MLSPQLKSHFFQAVTIKNNDRSFYIYISACFIYVQIPLDVLIDCLNKLSLEMVKWGLENICSPAMLAAWVHIFLSRVGREQANDTVVTIYNGEQISVRKEAADFLEQD